MNVNVLTLQYFMFTLYAALLSKQLLLELNHDFKIFSCIIVKSSGSLFVPIFPSLSLPHSLLFIPGPRSDIWEAEGGELLHSEGGGQIGDAH